jgi:transcriptional regulator with XRE-family HTH domain
MDQVVKAVKDLREHLGLSQQEFANRIGSSIRAVANYEKDRRPTARLLLQLIRLADSENKTVAAAAFSGALREELGEDGAGFFSDFVSNAQMEVLGAARDLSGLHSTKLSLKQKTLVSNVQRRLSGITKYLSQSNPFRHYEAEPK